jgi:hypothetical protein
MASLESQTRVQAELLKRGGVAEQVIETMREMLQMARAAGDSEGERHLSMALSFRYDTLAEMDPGGESAAGHSAAAAAHRERAAAIEAVLGPALEPKELVAAVTGKAGMSSTGMGPPSLKSRGPSMFGTPSDGDPLGLMADLPMPMPPRRGNAPKAAPKSPPDDRSVM